MRGISTSLTGENLKNVDWSNPAGSITLPPSEGGYAINDLGVLSGVITCEYSKNGHRVLTSWDVRGDRSIIVSWRPDPTVNLEIDRNEVRWLGDATRPPLPVLPQPGLFYLDRGDKTEVGTTGQEIDPEGINHPAHYNSHPSGVECIQIIRHHTSNVGMAIKYLWRAGLKLEPGLDARAMEIKDLKKAVFYLNDEIKRLEEGNDE